MVEKKTNIFFIITPIQYVNALELINALDLYDDNNVLVLMSIFHKSNEEILQMLDKSKWKKIVYLSNSRKPITTISFFKYIFKSRNVLLNIINDYKGISKIIIGNYNDLLNQFVIQNCRYEKLFLLDDGFASYEISSERFLELESGNSIITLDRYKKPRVKVIKLLLRLRNKVPLELFFFSAFKLKENAKDSFIVNDYTLVRSQILDQASGKKMFFIGQPLTELNIISEQLFLEKMRILVESCPDLKIIYIPHRTEKEDKLKLLSSIVEIKKLYLPIEIAILRETSLPEMFCTFYSSAIFNLSIIYREKFQYKMIRLAKEQLQKNVNGIVAVYHHAGNTSENGVEVVDL